MSDLKNINPDPDNEEEIESPTDGPPPDWMKTATSSAGSSFKENEAPEWLRNIRSGKGVSAESGAKAEPAGDKPEAGFGETLSDLERLLAEEGIDLTGVADDRPEGAEGMSVKDWMIATSDDEIIRRKVGAEPIEEAATPAPAEEPEWSPAPALEFAPNVLEEELPDWLREISDEVETSPPLVAPLEARPVAAKPADEAGVLPGDEDLPDWLREVSEQVQADVPAVVSETRPVAEVDDLMLRDEGLPDWLQGISDEPAAVAEPLGEPDLGVDFEAAEVDEDAPAWLEEVEEEEDQTLVLTATSDDKFVVTDELPSWLREVDEDQAESPVVPAEPEPEPILPEVPSETEADMLEEELPDWLQEADESVLDIDLGPDFEPAPYPITDSTDTAIDEENLPDWLRDVQEAEVEAESELAGLMEAEPEVDEELEEIEAAGLPDWLKEVQGEEASITPAVPSPTVVEPSPITFETGAEVVEEEFEEELPDWLREAADESAEAGFGLEVLAAAPAAEAREELPDWLQGIEVAEEEPFEPSEPSPDEFGLGAGEEKESQPALVQEELPDWLKEVQAESEELVAFEQIAELEVEESVVVETELPDWLQEEEEAEFPTEALLPEPEPAVAEVAAPELEIPVEGEPEEAEPILVELPTTPVVVAEAAVPAAGASLADLPDWLKKLREGDVEEEEIAVVPVEPLPKPAVVSAMVSSVVAPEAEPTAEVAIPEEASERLEQARVARDAGNIDEALQYYENLVSSGLHLDRIIEDIKQIIKSYPANAMLYQVMGDAMMKDGRLQSALDAYRTALAKL